MKPYLNFFFFAVLLNTAASLECETCIGVEQHCSGERQTCGYGQDVCATVLTEVTIDGITGSSIVKGCNTKEICSKDLNFGSNVVAKVECSKAAASYGSFFLSVLSLLVVKMLL